MSTDTLLHLSIVFVFPLFSSDECGSHARNNLLPFYEKKRKEDHNGTDGMKKNKKQETKQKEKVQLITSLGFLTRLN